jgi:MtrB/PioB family decaheme-associated outer membrane protein
MKTKLMYILIAGMLAASGAFAQDGQFKLSGSAALGGIGNYEDAKDAAKLHEYRDLSNGPLSNFNLQGRSGRFHFDAFGENMGRDDMYIYLQGGMYGEFKYRAYGNWLTHNFGFGPDGARTPYTDPGSVSLILLSTIPAQLGNSSVPPWISFDFGTSRRDAGGNFEFSHGSPWYARVDLNEVTQSGINKVDAAALGTSPGNGFVDLPYPIDFHTRNVSGEAGYQSPRGHLSVNLIQSKFKNANELLNFQNPFFGFGTDTSTFAPDNNYFRFSISGMLRQLPWNSTLTGRVTHDKVTDTQDIISEVLNTSGSNVLTPTNPNLQVFNGKINNTTAQFSFTSAAARGLDLRAYYKYYKRHNSSSEIEFQTLTNGLACFTGGTTSPATVPAFCTGERYGYMKHNPGVEADYRVSRANRLNAGFDYLDMNRDRFDADETREKRAFVQWTNTALDSITARIKYQYLQRRSDFLTDNAGFNANDPYYLERFNRSFDVTNLNQHLVKGNLDWAPLEQLDFGVEVYLKRNDYKDLTLGRLNDDRREIYASVTYGEPSKFIVTLFGDIEFIDYDSYHRTINASPCPATLPNCFDPNSPPATAAYNWAAQLQDKNWVVELGAEWPVTEKLMIKGSAFVQETRGTVDFQAQTLASGAPAALLFPINAYDNTRRWSVNPQAVYQIVRQVELTVGYAFEKYRYRDAQYDGYKYTIGSGTTTSYLAGIYAFPDYRANMVYGTVRYRF